MTPKKECSAALALILISLTAGGRFSAVFAAPRRASAVPRLPLSAAPVSVALPKMTPAAAVAPAAAVVDALAQDPRIEALAKPGASQAAPELPLNSLFEGSAPSLPPAVGDAPAGNFTGSASPASAAPRLAPSRMAARRRAAAAAGTAAPALSDRTAAYYEQTPNWAKSLRADLSKLTPEERRRYEQALSELRPIARFMARFWIKARENDIQVPPNILTLHAVLNWAGLVKKFAKAPYNWDLGSAVADLIKTVFERALSEQYEGRALKRELEDVRTSLGMTKTVSGGKETWSLPDWVKTPARLPRFDSLAVPAAQPAEAAPVETIVEKLHLFKVSELGALPAPDYHVSATVKDRLDDLLMLYSTRYWEKFFPYLIGPTGEGKSSLIQHLFAMPELIKILGRAVPVLAIPVKDFMTQRELLGGKNAQGGIDLGFLSMAAKHGWALVLEEVDQASPEFLKGLNEALLQLRKFGTLEFTVSGKTIRITAHPHFWVAATGNGAEGNFALTRNEHSPDFMQRWMIRRYDPMKPVETAEIMRGLAVQWYGDSFVSRHKLDLAFFEGLLTGFHEPLRALTVSAMGGENLEPYEFNRRTLHRFLKRYLWDLGDHEKRGLAVDDKTRGLLLGRELMEAYGTEVRTEADRDAIWDLMNGFFELEKKHRIQQEDIALDVTGLGREGGTLVVSEKLVPLEVPLRENGGTLVPGEKHRLTLVPSLARNIYRSLRNRQFGDPEFATGPTGTSKTSKHHFLAHLLGEPLMELNLHSVTPLGEIHGGMSRKEGTQDFEFHPGIFARAMMHDPEGLLEDKRPMSAQEVLKSRHIGATLIVNEGNASGVLETANPAIDNRVLPLNDGQHAAVAGAGFHYVVTWNPAGEGYKGDPMSPAFTSRGQTIHHDDPDEDELAEIVLDQLTGIPRSEIVSKP